jgi:hypothetical protein
MTSLKQLTHRHQFPEYLNERGLTGTAVEVGVARGIFSKTLLDTWKGQKLILVDLWSHREHSRDGCNDVDSVQQSRFDECMSRLEPHSSRIDVRRTWSHLAAPTVPDDSLDLVFIDAEHSYPWVMLDMWLWYPKLKRGGLFSGDDYVDPVQPMLEVKWAVHDFLKYFPADLHILPEDGLHLNPTWSFHKP